MRQVGYTKKQLVEFKSLWSGFGVRAYWSRFRVRF